MAVNPTPGGKVEIDSLPAPSPREDLSAGKTADVSQLVTEDINDRKLLRLFQTYAFFGAGALIIVTFATLFWWVYLIGTHVTDPAVTTTYRVSFFVAPVVVLASLGALLTLALLKFAFRPATKEEDDPSPLSLLHGLAQQILELAKEYFKGRKGGE
jgi:hypothetical protein